MASVFFAGGTNGPNLGAGAHHGVTEPRTAHRAAPDGFYGHSSGVNNVNDIQGGRGYPYGNVLGGANGAGVNGSANGHRSPTTSGFGNGGHDSPNPFASRNRSPSNGFANPNANHSPPLGFPGALRASLNNGNNVSNGFSNGNRSPSTVGFGNVSLPPLHSFFQGINGHGVQGVNGMDGVKTVAGTTEPTGIGSISRLKFLVEEVGKGVDTLGAGNPKPIEDVAKLKLVTATQELLGTVRPPQDAIMGWFAYMGIVSAVHVFQDWQVFDAVPPTGMISYAELAEKVNAEEAVLLRIAWMLTSTSILRHHASGHISHTPVSLLLRESEPMGSMFKVMYKNVVEVSVALPAYFNAYGRKEPTGPNHLPSSFLEGQPELQYSQVLNQDPARRQVFMHAMSLNHRRVPTTGMYDIGWVIEKARQDSSRPVWVDVGGGTGFTVKVFREVYPDLPAAQCVVQDLPEVIEEANANPDPELKDVKFVAFDFHKESPVPGALVYYLRHVLRESGDLVCINILKNIAASMVDDSRILISEQITENPPPVFSAFKDYTMLSLGGKERTLENFNQVAEAAGLRISGVFPDRGTPHAVIELALATARWNRHGDELRKTATI